MARKPVKKTRDKPSKKPNKPDTRRASSYQTVGQRVAASKAAFLRSLRSKMGVISAAAQECNISRTTVYEWMRVDPDFRRNVDFINEYAIDFVESKMFEGINNGDRQLIQFFLSTRGKRRGYSTRIEVQEEKRSTIQLNVTQYEDEY